MALISGACSSNKTDTSAKNPGGNYPYFVTIDTQGGEEWAPIGVLDGDNLEGRLGEPTQEGFNFLGWTLNPDTTDVYDLAMPIHDNITIYAMWDGAPGAGAEMYRLTVHLQGGAIPNVPMQTVNIDYRGGKMLKQLPRMNQVPNAAGIDEMFGAYNTQPDGRGRFITQDTVLNSDMDIYAIYGKIINSLDNLTTITCNDPNVKYVFAPSSTSVSSSTWTPLCATENAPFRGQFFKNPNQALNITLNNANQIELAGLFGYTDGADLYMLTIFSNYPNVSKAGGLFAAYAKNTRILQTGVLSNVVITGADYAGVFVGKGDNITVEVNYAAQMTIRGKYAGGVVGYVENSNISNIFWQRTLVSSKEAGSYIGGIAGYMKNCTLDNVSLLSTYSYALIHGVVANHANSCAGGLVGYMENSKATSVSAWTDNITAAVDNTYAGVIAGCVNGGSISGAQSYGAASAYGTTNSAAGGIAGILTNGATVSYAMSKAIVKAGTGATAGGIVGDASQGTVKNSLMLAEAFSGTTVDMIVGKGTSTGSYRRAGIENGLNSGQYYTGGTNLVSIKYNKDFFSTTLGWNLTDNSSLWEMKDYYQYPTFRSDHMPDFIHITKPEQLLLIGANTAYPNTGFYVLMNDLDLSSYDNWTSAGKGFNSSLNVFMGGFEGNGKKVTGLKGGSLFAQVTAFDIANVVRDRAFIRNLTLENVNVTGGGALLASSGEYSTIDNVHVTGTITNGTGGIVGESRGRIYNSSFNGSITSADGNIGGIASTAFLVENCKADAAITVTTTLSTQNAYIGGIIGQASASTENGGPSTIKSSYAKGSININTVATSGTRVGVYGIAGSAGYGISVLSTYSDVAINIASAGTKCGVYGVTNTVSQPNIMVKSNLFLGGAPSITSSKQETARVVNSVSATYAATATIEKNFVNPALIHNTTSSTSVAGEDVTLPLTADYLTNTVGWDITNGPWRFDTTTSRPVLAWE